MQKRVKVRRTWKTKPATRVFKDKRRQDKHRRWNAEVSY